MPEFANDGGPLVALAAEDAAMWLGADGSSESAAARSDYERACAAEYPAGVMPVANGTAVILGAQEHVAAAWWQRSSAGGVFLVGCTFADVGADQDLARMLDDGSITAWAPIGVMTVRSGKVLLFHAAGTVGDLHIDPGREPAVIGDALSVVLAPGEYELSAREVSIPDRALYSAVRWARR